MTKEPCCEQCGKKLYEDDDDDEPNGQFYLQVCRSCYEKAQTVEKLKKEIIAWAKRKEPKHKSRKKEPKPTYIV